MPQAHNSCSKSPKHDQCSCWYFDADADADTLMLILIPTFRQQKWRGWGLCSMNRLNSFFKKISRTMMIILISFWSWISDDLWWRQISKVWSGQRKLEFSLAASLEDIIHAPSDVTWARLFCRVNLSAWCTTLEIQIDTFKNRFYCRVEKLTSWNRRTGSRRKGSGFLLPIYKELLKWKPDSKDPLPACWRSWSRKSARRGKMISRYTNTFV